MSESGVVPISLSAVAPPAESGVSGIFPGSSAPQAAPAQPLLPAETGALSSAAVPLNGTPQASAILDILSQIETAELRQSVPAALTQDVFGKTILRHASSGYGSATHAQVEQTLSGALQTDPAGLADSTAASAGSGETSGHAGAVFGHGHAAAHHAAVHHQDDEMMEMLSGYYAPFFEDPVIPREEEESGPWAFSWVLPRRVARRVRQVFAARRTSRASQVLTVGALCLLGVGGMFFLLPDGRTGAFFAVMCGIGLAAVAALRYFFERS